MNNTIKVKFIDDETAVHTPVIPTYGSEKAAGFDLYSTHDAFLYKGIPTLVKTGLKVQIPEGTELQIRPRSGMALKDGITVLNTPGTIDEDYRGEIGVILFWTGADTGNNNFNIVSDNCRSLIIVPAGTRIAQGVLSPVIHANFELVEDLDTTERGEGGFGHSGIK